MVFGIFTSLWKFLMVIGYAITGNIDKARSTWETNPNVIRASMDEVISDKQKSINEMLDAVAEMINLQEQKKQELARIKAKLAEKMRIRSAAKGMTEERIRKLQAEGKTPEQIKADTEFMRHSSAFTTVSAEITGLEGNVERLNVDIAALQVKLDQYKIQLERMKRDLESSKAKKSDLVARAVTAEQELRLNKMLAGITQDSSVANREAELEAAVGKHEAKARVAGELAGTDTVVSDAQYLDYAAKNAAVSEFDALLYGSQKVEDAAKGEIAKPDAPAAERLDS